MAAVDAAKSAIGLLRGASSLADPELLGAVTRVALHAGHALDAATTATLARCGEAESVSTGVSIPVGGAGVSADAVMCRLLSWLGSAVRVACSVAASGLLQSALSAPDISRLPLSCPWESKGDEKEDEKEREEFSTASLTTQWLQHSLDGAEALLAVGADGQGSLIARDVSLLCPTFLMESTRRLLQLRRVALTGDPHVAASAAEEACSWVDATLCRSAVSNMTLGLGPVTALASPVLRSMRHIRMQVRAGCVACTVALAALCIVRIESCASVVCPGSVSR